MRWNNYKLRQLSLLRSAMDCYYKLRQLFYYKVRHGLLQVATGITKCDRIITNCDSLVYYKVRWTVVTNCDSFFITKCGTVYYKLRQVLQSAMDLLQIATAITKCDDYYKLRQYNPPLANWSGIRQIFSGLKVFWKRLSLTCTMMRL